VVGVRHRWLPFPLAAERQWSRGRICGRSKNLASSGGPYEEASSLRVRRVHNLAFHPRVLAIARSSLGADNARHWGLRDNPGFASGILVRKI
jgi:hypothetical protein